MFERFTADARNVVVHAQQEARTLQHSRIGTEHVLLGLLAVPTGIAAQALRQLGIGADLVRTEITERVGVGEESSPAGHVPFSSRAKKVLELSLREALNLNHNYIGTEHILLAIERENKGVAAQILAKHLPTGRTIGQTVKPLLDNSSPAGDTPAKQTRTTAAAEVVAAAEALAGDAPMGSHHLLEALIRAEGSMAATVLTQLGVHPDAVATKVDALDTDATTDATPEETAARKMEVRVEGDEVHLVFRDAATLSLARTAQELTGGPIRAAGPLAGQFVPLWTRTNDILLTLVQSLKPDADTEGRDLPKATMLVRRVLHDRLRRRN
ncbi:Clp protease N-terminal domain-containing protein [Actinophytocola sediminis]